MDERSNVKHKRERDTKNMQIALALYFVVGERFRTPCQFEKSY